MSDVFFQELGLHHPDHHLGVRAASHGCQTGRMLERIEEVLLTTEPDWVLVYGDTNSTVAGALAAAKLHIPVAHVEAGLRSFNRRMPEEINRVVTDHIADLVFAPTDAAVRNLKNEGIPQERIRKVGDVMYDVALHYGDVAERNSTVLQRHRLQPRAYVLCTIHRAENTDDPGKLAELAVAISLASKQLRVVLPLHPRTRKALGTAGVSFPDSVLVIDPVGYLDMVMLEKNAAVIATDSGGVQKEAFFHSVPCVTLRTETEWVELVELGWNRIPIDWTPSAISAAILSAIGSTGADARPYGDGHAADAIAKELFANCPRAQQQ